MPRRRAAALPPLVGVSALMLLAGCGATKSAPTTTTGVRAEPVKASADALHNVASVVDHPVYWIPGVTPVTYELTQTADGRIYIRYLPNGVALGDPRPGFLTVGTYPRSDAFTSVQRAAKRSGAVVKALPGGGLMVSQKATPTSAFFAFPTSTVLVEVFDPTAGRAATYVTSGAVKPVPAQP